jgi:hypothetical protein
MNILSEQEKAWLAAIVEGEGCLWLTFERRTPKSRDYQATFTVAGVHVSNTNPYLIRAVSELWKRLNMRFHYTWSHQDGKADALTIICNSVGSCAKLLREIRPYLRTKQVEADIMLEYAQYRDQLMKKRGPDGRYKDYIDRKYVEKLVKQHKYAKHLRYDMSRISRKAGEILDLSELRSSETLRETPNGDDKVRASTVM